MALLLSADAALLPDVRAALDLTGWLADILVPHAPVWLLRVAFDRLADLDPPPPGAEPLVETELRLPGADGAPLAARLYAPTRLGAARGPLLFFIHGGGFMVGSLASHAPTCRALAVALGWRVLAVMYRRAPEACFPAAALDVLAAYAHVCAQRDDFLLETRTPCIVVAGDSAGGQLTLELGLRVRDDRRAAAGAATPRLDPVLLVPIYPVINSYIDTPSKARFASGFGLTAAGVERFAASYLGARRADLARDAYLNPDLQTDLRGPPPIVLLTAQFDVLASEGAAFVATARARGADVEHVEAEWRVHGCVQGLTVVPSNRRLLERLAARAHQAARRGRRAQQAAAGLGYACARGRRPHPAEPIRAAAARRRRAAAVKRRKEWRRASRAPAYSNAAHRASSGKSAGRSFPACTAAAESARILSSAADQQPRALRKRLALAQVRARATRLQARPLTPAMWSLKAQAQEQAESAGGQ